MHTHVHILEGLCCFSGENTFLEKVRRVGFGERKREKRFSISFSSFTLFHTQLNYFHVYCVCVCVSVMETKGIWVKTQKETKAGQTLSLELFLCSRPAQQTQLFFQLGIISSSCPKSWESPDPAGGWQSPGPWLDLPGLVVFLSVSPGVGVFGEWWGGAEQAFRGGGETDMPDKEIHVVWMLWMLQIETRNKFKAK